MNQMTMNQLKEEVHQMKKKEEASASLQLSVTRSGTKYQISVGTKEDVQKVPLVYSLWGAAHKSKENTAQLSTQAVANAAAVRAAAGAATHEPHDGDTKQVIARINAEPKPEQLNIGTTLAPTVATAAAEKAAADVAALERAAAEQTLKENTAQHSTQAVAIGITTAPTVADAAAEKAAADVAALERAAAEQTGATVAVERAAINTDTEAAATVNNLHDEINRLQLLLTAERDAAAAARAAADEAAATINSLEMEKRRILRLLAAEKAATAVKVYVPGYNIPMTQAEHLAALQRQIQYLTEQLHAQAIPAHWQWRAQMAIMAETANVEEAVMASSSPVPPITNEPARGGEHTRAQTTALANLRSSSATYAEAVMSSAPDVKRSTSTNDNGRGHPANAASALAATGPDPARNSSVQQHNLADKAEAAALQAAADAAAAATTEPRILRAVLLAAAATASALARSIPPDTVTAHRRGGRPPPKRPRANPRPRPRRTQRSAGPSAPRVTDTHTATQSRRTQQGQHNPPTANSLLREGQNRPRPGAPFTSSNHAASSAMPATRFAPPLSPAVTRRNGRNIADSAKQPRMTQQGQHNPPTANSLLREGQNRPRPGAPFTSSNHAASSAMPATRFAPPLSPAVTRRNGRDIAESV